MSSVLWYIHDAHVSGHLGIKKTLSRANECPFYWTKMRESVEEYVKACDICGEANNPQRKQRHALQRYTVGARFERIGVDIAGPYPETARKNSYILVISDYFSKLVEIFPLVNIQAETVADVLFRGWIKRYGCPREIHSDQGRQFESAVFLEMCKLLEISKTRTTPLHPRSDGMVERMNRTIQNVLSKYVQENQKDWDLHIDFIVMAYNSCEHESTGCPPYKIMYGENIVLPVDILTNNASASDTNENQGNVNGFVPTLQSNLKRIHAYVRKNLSKSAEKQKKHYDAHVKELKYAVGDLVWRNQKKTLPGVKTKITRHWTGPWKISEKLCDVLFRIRHSDSSPSVIIHGDNLKRYHGPKTIVLRTDTHVQTVIKQPDLQSFMAHKTLESVKISSKYSLAGNSNMQNDDVTCTELGSKETPILLISENQVGEVRETFGTKVTCVLLEEAVLSRKTSPECLDDEIIRQTSNKFGNNKGEAGQYMTCINAISTICSKTGDEVMKHDAFFALNNSVTSVLSLQRSKEQGKQGKHCSPNSRVYCSIKEQRSTEEREKFSQAARGDSLTPDQRSKEQRFSRNARASIQSIESEICSPFARAAGGLTCDNSPICSVKAKEIRRDLFKMDREFVCDTCYRGYSHRRNLTRHIQEKHGDISYYPCTEYLCRGRFMRRGFLVTHLRKSHNIDRDKAERLSRRVERVRKQDSYVLFQYHSDISDLSDDESCFDKLSLQGNSLEKVLAENDRQNSNIVQELCDSLKTFTDNSDNSLYSAVRPVPMNDFDITSQELFDFNVDELAMEVEMEKIRRDGTGFIDDSIAVNNVNVDENTCSVILMKDDDKDVAAIGTSDDDKDVTATGTSDDDYDVAAIGTSDDDKDVTAT